LREGLHFFIHFERRVAFSSILREGLHFFIHLQENYVTFHPLTKRVMASLSNLSTGSYVWQPLKHASYLWITSLGAHALQWFTVTCALFQIIPSPFWSKKTFWSHILRNAWLFTRCCCSLLWTVVSHGTSPIWLEHCCSSIVFISWKREERESSQLSHDLGPHKKEFSLKSFRNVALTIWTRQFECYNLKVS
jgi:hypothetical protein